MLTRISFFNFRYGKSDPNHCRGSVFRIFAPDRANAEDIKSCDRVFLQYGQGSWMSHASGSNGWAPKVMPCPGREFNRQAAKNKNWCDKEQWYEEAIKMNKTKFENVLLSHF